MMSIIFRQAMNLPSERDGKKRIRKAGVYKGLFKRTIANLTPKIRFRNRVCRVSVFFSIFKPIRALIKLLWSLLAIIIIVFFSTFYSVGLFFRLLFIIFFSKFNILIK